MTFPNFADWKAPWEEEGKELDPEVVKKLVYSLRRSESESKDKIDSSSEKLSEYEKAIETYRKAEEEAKRKNESDAERASRERAESDAALKKSSEAVARENLLLKVRLEKNLTETQVKRLSGTTIEELLADADEYLKDITPAVEDDDSDEYESNLLKRKPKLKDPLDGTEKDTTSDAEFDKKLRERANRNLFLN